MPLLESILYKIDTFIILRFDDFKIDINMLVVLNEYLFVYSTLKTNRLLLMLKRVSILIFEFTEKNMLIL